METLLEVEVEEHPLPPDTWGEAPQSLLSRVDEQASSSIRPTTAPPRIEGE
jgi:hypothetical protein